MTTTESDHASAICQSFGIQAAGFDSKAMNFTKREFLDYTIQATGFGASDRVLEVAAGTCACGRSIAPHVSQVVCLDLTPQMLAVGEREAAKQGLSNMRFVVGDAESIPFEGGSFSVVISRLAFHHMLHPERVFSQMLRVLKPGGKLVLIDMEAAEPALRSTEDEIERLRDFSHVRNLSRDEMLGLYRQAGLTVAKCEVTRIPVALDAWMELTQTPSELRKQITDRMMADIRGGAKTGFGPYLEGDKVYFNQRWILIVGVSVQPE